MNAPLKCSHAVHVYIHQCFVSEHCISSLFVSTAPAPLAQPIANAAQYGNSRIQAIMLKRLACLLTQYTPLLHLFNTTLLDLVPFIQNQQAQTVIRHIHMLPVLFHFVAVKMPQLNKPIYHF